MNQTRKKLRGRLGLVAVLFVIALAYLIPAPFNYALQGINNVAHVGLPTISEDTFQLGLDLQGGAQLVYEADVSQIPQQERNDAVEGVRDVIERRVNGLGVSEPVVQTAHVGDAYRINVELPGIEDSNDAIKLIGETPILEFREQNTEPQRELTSEERERIVRENTDAEARAKEVVEKIDDGATFASLVTEYSEDPLTKDDGGTLGSIAIDNQAVSEFYAWAKSHEEGDTSDVLETDVGFHILQRGAQVDGEKKIQASHILICYLGARNCDEPLYTKEEARQKAKEIFDQAHAENFAALAQEHSADRSNKDDGGALPWFGRDTMVQEFEQAVFDIEPGNIVGPVETPFGFHVIYKQDETTVEYDIAHIMLAKLLPEHIVPPQEQWTPTALGGKQLDRAEVAVDPQTGAVQVALQFDSEGAKLFEEITRQNIGQPVAIYLDGEPISIPVVQNAIAGGRAVITGDFSIQEAKELAQRLNTGALPVPIELVSQQEIGASLGAESLRQSLIAGIIAVILVMVFMGIYYRIPGVVSIISLTVYISLTLAIFKLIHVTLTLAGIAGFILSIGMAVDANVLIFERLKEELKTGKNLKAAVEEGFLRAWTSIRDGNVSTLITCVILIGFGSSFVQGFALTLAVGVLLSMITAISFTRMLLRFIAPWFGRYGNRGFVGASKDNSSDSSLVEERV